MGDFARLTEESSGAPAASATSAAGARAAACAASPASPASSETAASAVRAGTREWQSDGSLGAFPTLTRWSA